MRSILFFSDAAEGLNRYVAKNVAPHLFFFCHYAPGTLPLYSDDAKFIAGALNLYKLAYDAGITPGLERMAEKCRMSYRKEDLKKQMELIQALRTVEGHNTCDRETLERRNRWLKGAVGKDDISAMQPEDFTKALDNLEKTGIVFHNILLDYAKKASVCKAKKKLVAEWENLILEYYAKKSNRKIFEEQLKQAYLLQCGSSLEQMQRANIDFRWKLAIWCKNYYLLEDEKKVDILSDALTKYSDQMNAEQREKTEEEIRAHQKNILNIKRKISGKVNNVVTDEVKLSDYLEYYYLNLRSALKALMPDVVSEPKGTMLPEDIMQRLIKKDFEGVPVEDFG